MSASASDLVRQAAPNFATTLSGSMLNTDTSMSLSSATGLPTSTGITLVVDATDPTSGAATPTLKEVMTGTLSGTTVSNLVRGQEGTTTQAHASGANVVMWITANLWNDFQTAFLLGHSQLDGSHVANLPLTTPKITTSLKDANANTWLGATATSSAVNYLNNANAATGNAPVLSAVGSDTNVDLYIRAKGTGSPRFSGNFDAWADANESWSYASSTTITVPTDATTKYDIGDYIKLTQSATVKYFVVTGVTSTVLTVSGLSGATVANSAITANYYSKARQPHGFPEGAGPVFNPYKFSAYNNAVQNLASNSKVSFNTKDFDTGSNFDAVTNNRFTAPLAGFYYFEATVYVQASTANISFNFYKNGSPIQPIGFVADTSGNDHALAGTWFGQLAANDYVEIFYNGSVTRNIYGASGQRHTHFAGFLVSPL